MSHAFRGTLPKVADFIEKNREQLIERFVEQAGKLESARGLKPYEIIDTLPAYLSALAAVSRQGHRGDPARTKKRLEETHIGLRLRHGYNQEEVTGERVRGDDLHRPAPPRSRVLLEEQFHRLNRTRRVTGSSSPRSSASPGRPPFRSGLFLLRLPPLALRVPPTCMGGDLTIDHTLQLSQERPGKELRV